MRCPKCESENRDGAKFCDECGFSLAGLTSDSIEPIQDESEGVVTDAEPQDEAAPADETPIDNEDVEVEEFPTQELYEIDPSEELLRELPDDLAKKSEEPEAAKTEPEGVKESMDLSGFDTQSEDYGETLIDPSIELPKPNWHDGATMQMKPIESEEPEKSRDYLASSTRKKDNRKKYTVIAIVAAVVVIAVVALVTFQMHLWGGKAIPNVVGMTQADATSVLEGEGFTVKASQVKSDDTEGLVLISDPEAGGRAAEGSEVLIHIATARIVPENIVGMTTEKATEALAEEGFENVRFETKPSDKPEGQVLSVSPEPGTRAKSAAEIVVTVAGPFVVPDVSSMYLDDAIAAIEEAGYGYDILYVVSEDYPDGTMLGTSPVAGTKAPGGSVVYIQIAQDKGTQLENLARSALAPGTSVVVNGVSYTIDSLDTVSYVGNGTVSYTATGRAYTSLAGEMVYGSPTTFTSVVTFSDDNQIIGF